MKDDLNQIAKIEKAIKAKYGSQAIKNPKSGWSPEKEEKYKRDVKDFYRKKSRNGHGERLSAASADTNKPSCEVCSKAFHFMTIADEIEYIRWGVCSACHVFHIQAREQRWLSGWRPDKESVFKN